MIALKFKKQYFSNNVRVFYSHSIAKCLFLKILREGITIVEIYIIINDNIPVPDSWQLDSD